MAEKTRLTAAQLTHLRQMLEEKRDDLIRRQRTETEDVVGSDQEQHSRDDDAKKEATIEQVVPLAEQQRQLLPEIERALEKMDAGTYGLSEMSDEPIPYERLLAVPWARANVDEIEGTGR